MIHKMPAPGGMEGTANRYRQISQGRGLPAGSGGGEIPPIVYVPLETENLVAIQDEDGLTIYIN